MGYTMFLGDTKDMSNEFDVVVPKYEDAITQINQQGIPHFISFDSILGYDVAVWLIQSVTNGLFSFPENFSFSIHNGGILAKNNIEALLNNYLHFKVFIPLGYCSLSDYRN